MFALRKKIILIIKAITNKEIPKIGEWNTQAIEMVKKDKTIEIAPENKETPMFNNVPKKGITSPKTTNGLKICLIPTYIINKPTSL